ncbi:U-box domain-containing protein 52-like isoform X2 [Phalaenopsis equestris]|uniref:U-box domain-containing protein 52-like isoform X2 n=1 Tax=Phalaenopsis equestris TaxID=78828 RepID=UPI0009E4F3BA|nr:U-box domain-containing protein 52-like isoform X2 [Phalaenopsis equestris]
MEEGSSLSIAAVAVDKDKNSKNAMKWAMNNLTHSSDIILIHVRSKSSLTEVSSEVTREQADAEINQLFLHYRVFCASKGMQVKEIVLECADISKAIVDYINTNYIQNIVVGVSNKSLLMKKFRHPDVPSCLIKLAPDFCTVYVISKGSARISAKVNWRGSAPATPQHERTERRSLDRLPDFMKTNLRDGSLSIGHSAPDSQILDKNDSSSRPRRSADYHDLLPDEIDLMRGLGFSSMDFGDSFEHSLASMNSPRSSLSPIASHNRELETEMRKLKLELKQTMEMYSNACKEAITAKQKAMELQQWKLEESKKFEELKQAEEAALAIAEMEKAKCKAAIEAAEAAKRIAELESQKRKNAEIKARREAVEKKKALEELVHNDIRYRKYTIEEIEDATNKFAAERKIGEGGYGPVYKGYLDHTPVAIKILKPDAAQGRKQFQQEVEVLSCIRHPNMVLLLGACPEYGCLVYEFMDNGSLDDRLFRRRNTPPLPWNVRFKIAAEIATALLFLHQTKPEPLVHRDLKPANILLDRNYVSKISDVGLARLVPPSIADSVTQYHMTSAAGTFCYIDPEYQQTGMLGVKSDVYSLGVMLLQLITAKPPMGLTHHVERAIEKGTFLQLLDPAITDWPVEQALDFAKLALKCAELRRKDRPDLGAVVFPELNRLREVGNEYKTSHQHSVTKHNFPPRPHSYNNLQRRSRLLVQKEKAVNNSSGATKWKLESDSDFKAG